MIVAREKKKNNIAEYILYMWQIEGIIRSNYFDLDKINATVINKFDVSPEIKKEMREWYSGLIANMKAQGIEDKGHLKELNDYVEQLNSLHQRLLTVHQDKTYQDLYYLASKNIDALIKKSAETIANEIEACLTGLYGLMMLKLKGTEVNSETRMAMGSFSKLVAYLAAQYHKGQLNEPSVSVERKN